MRRARPRTGLLGRPAAASGPGPRGIRARSGRRSGPPAGHAPVSHPPAAENHVPRLAACRRHPTPPAPSALRAAAAPDACRVKTGCPGPARPRASDRPPARPDRHPGGRDLPCRHGLHTRARESAARRGTAARAGCSPQPGLLRCRGSQCFGSGDGSPSASRKQR